MFCENAFTNCPCWQVDKCIQVCDIEGLYVPYPSSNEGSAGCGDENICALPTPIGANLSCCEAVTVCVDEIDTLEVTSAIMATRFGENITYSFELRACNLCDTDVVLSQYAIILEVSDTPDGPWTPIESTVKNVIDGSVIKSGECKNIIIANAIPRRDYQPERFYRIVIRTFSGKSSDSVVVPFPNPFVADCDITQLTLVDDDNITEPSTFLITDTIALCLTRTYSLQLFPHCGKSIVNTASILEGPSPPPGQEPIATSSARIDIVCPTYTLQGSGILDCNAEGLCQITGTVTFSASCLSYPKTYPYFVQYSIGQQSGQIVGGGTITLNPTMLSGTSEFSGTVRFEAGSSITIVLRSQAGIYNLTECAYNRIPFGPSTAFIATFEGLEDL